MNDDDGADNNFQNNFQFQEIWTSARWATKWNFYAKGVAKMHAQLNVCVMYHATAQNLRSTSVTSIFSVKQSRTHLFEKGRMSSCFVLTTGSLQRLGGPKTLKSDMSSWYLSSNLSHEEFVKLMKEISGIQHAPRTVIDWVTVWFNPPKLPLLYEARCKGELRNNFRRRRIFNWGQRLDPRVFLLFCHHKKAATAAGTESLPFCSAEPRLNN